MMDLTARVMCACATELLKVAAARARMTVAQSRIGRRPMRVDTMLRKEKNGTLYKHADEKLSASIFDTPHWKVVGEKAVETASKRQAVRVAAEEALASRLKGMLNRGEYKTQTGIFKKKAGAMQTTGSSDGSPAVVPYADATDMDGRARLKKKRWEVASIGDGPSKPDKLDGRDAAITQLGPGVSMGSTGLAYSNSGELS